MSLHAPKGWEPRLPRRFRDFLADLWDHLNLPVPTAAQYAIADFLQLSYERGGSLGARAMVKAFRGIGKSWITDAFVVWALDRNPNHKVEIISANEALAKDNAQFIRNIINEYPPCAHLKTRRGQKAQSTSFDVGPASTSKDPSVKTAGITGQITGTRSTLIISDDVEVPKNSLTSAMRLKLSNLIGEYDSIIVPGGHIFYLGTPQSIESIYNGLPEKGYDVKCWPAETPLTPENYVSMVPSMTTDPTTGESFMLPQSKSQLGRLVQDLIAQGMPPGTPVDPARFTKEVLDAKKMSMGASSYQLQFLLDTTLSDLNRYPLKLSHMIVMHVMDKGANPRAPAEVSWMPDPARRWTTEEAPCVGMRGDAYYKPAAISTDLFVPFDFTVMSIDPSGKGADETAYAVIKVCRGMLYLVATGGLPGGYDDVTLTELAGIAKANGVNHIVVENNFGQGMFATLFRPYLQKISHGAAVEERTVRQSKEMRIIDTLEPVLNQHRLVTTPEVILKDFAEAQQKDPSKSVFYQLSRVQRLKDSLPFDDRLDALEAAVWKCMGLLGLDTSAQAEAEIMARKDEVAQRFIDQHKKAGTYGRAVATLGLEQQQEAWQQDNPLRRY